MQNIKTAKVKAYIEVQSESDNDLNTNPSMSNTSIPLRTAGTDQPGRSPVISTVARSIDDSFDQPESPSVSCCPPERLLYCRMDVYPRPLRQGSDKEMLQGQSESNTQLHPSEYLVFEILVQIFVCITS